LPELPKQELYQILVALLPGFVAAWVFHGLTAHRKASPFERVIHALIFTAFIFPTVSLIDFEAHRIGNRMDQPWGEWTQSTTVPAVSLAVGIGYGLLFSFLANMNFVHWLLGWVWLTKRTSFPSEWYSVLIKRRFIYLQLKNGRRIYGWPQEFPDYPDSGYFALEKAAWIVESPTNPNTFESVPLTATYLILIPAAEVCFVETEIRWNKALWKKKTEVYSTDELAKTAQKIRELIKLEDDKKASKEDEKQDEPKAAECAESGAKPEGAEPQDR
jgi:hypothetical protein